MLPHSPQLAAGVSLLRLGRRPASPAPAELCKPRVESSGLAPRSSAGERAAFNRAAVSALDEIPGPVGTLRREMKAETVPLPLFAC